MNKTSPQRQKLSTELRVCQEDYFSQVQLALRGLFRSGYQLTKNEIACMDGYLTEYSDVRIETWQALDDATREIINACKNHLIAKKEEIRLLDRFEFHKN